LEARFAPNLRMACGKSAQTGAWMGGDRRNEPQYRTTRGNRAASPGPVSDARQPQVLIGDTKRV